MGYFVAFSFINRTLSVISLTIEADVEIKLVELRAKKMNFCIHCNKCLRGNSDRCTVFKDDMTELYDKFYEADGFIIASPIYEMNIKAQLSTFFDRFRSAWHKGVEYPNFFAHKVGAGITVGGTRNGGQETAMKYYHQFFPDPGNDGLYRRFRYVFWSHALESRGWLH